MEEEKKSDSTNTEQGKAKNSKSKKERREDPAEREQQNILKRSSDCEQKRDAQAHSKQWREDNPEKCKAQNDRSHAKTKAAKLTVKVDSARINKSDTSHPNHGKFYS